MYVLVAHSVEPWHTHLTCQALMDAATEKKEVVMVTDDVLTIKDKFQEEPEGFPVLGAMRKKEGLILRR